MNIQQWQETFDYWFIVYNKVTISAALRPTFKNIELKKDAEAALKTHIQSLVAGFKEVQGRFEGLEK